MFLLFLLLFSKWLYFLLRCSTSIFISCIKGNTKAGLAQIKPLGTNRSKKVKVWGQIWFALNPTLRAVGEPRQKHQSLLFTSQPFPPNLAESSDYWMPVNLISLMSLKAPVTDTENFLSQYRQQHQFGQQMCHLYFLNAESEMLNVLFLCSADQTIRLLVLWNFHTFFDQLQKYILP